MGRRRRYRLGLSRAWVSVLDYGGQLRHDGRVLVGLTISVFLAALGTAALVTSSEAVAHALRPHLHWGSLFLPLDPADYGTIVGAAVGAEAAFLGLFYTTVGVIASTTYARVPGEIRSLFLRERTSVIYAWNIARPVTSPVIAAFNPRGIGMPQPDLADLFMAEYLKKRPDMDTIPMPEGAEHLRESIDRYLEPFQPANQVPDEGEAR